MENFNPLQDTKGVLFFFFNNIKKKTNNINNNNIKIKLIILKKNKSTPLVSWRGLKFSIKNPSFVIDNIAQDATHQNARIARNRNSKH